MNTFRKLIAHAKLPAAALALLGTLPAQALLFNWQDARISLDDTITAGAVMRVQGPDRMLVGIANGGAAYSVNEDDGNLNFKSGSLVASIAQLKTDLTVNYKQVGFFVRSVMFVNGTLADKNLFDAKDFGPGREAPLSELGTKRNDVKGHDGKRANILDAFAFGNFEVFNELVSVKLGRQVLNWGESTFIQNGLNSITSFDANRLQVPGFELNEITQPVPLLFASTTLIDNVSVDGFYQLGWQRTIIPASGSYFSTNDFAGIGGTRAYIDFGRAGENAIPGAPCLSAPGGPPTPVSCVPFGSSVPRARDRTPHSSGQFGGALHILIPPLRDLDLTLYAARYHSRLPLFSGTSRASPTAPSTDANYYTEYPKGIRLYGLSFNSSIPFGIAMQGEYSLKVGQPLQLQAVELLLTGLGQPSQIDPIPGDALGNKYIRGYRRHQVSQGDLSFTKLFGPSPWLKSDDTLVLAEFGYTYVHDLPSQSPGGMFYEGPAAYLPGEPATAAALGVPVQSQGAFPTKASWGYRVLMRSTYNNVMIGSLVLSPTLIWQHDVAGITPTPLINFVRDRRTLTPLLAARYGQSLQFELGYTTFFGAGQQNLLRDRDFVQTNVKYSF